MEKHVDDFGITWSIKWDKIGSWVARVALLVISFFLYRLIQELDDTRTQMQKTTETIYMIKGDMNVIRYQVNDIKEQIKEMRTE